MEEGFYFFFVNQATKFLLVLARVGGIFTTAPVFANVHLPVRIRVGLALALTFVFFPVVECELPRTEVLPFVCALVKETFVGLAIGFVAALVFAAVHVAGTYIDLLMGFGFANIVDPTTREQNAVIGQFQNLVATLLFLSINGHHVLLKGLADSFVVLPLAQGVFSEQVARGMLEMFAGVFGSALKIAMPVVGTIFLTDVSLGILARTVPQLNVFVVGFPAKLAVALFIIIVTLPFAFKVMAGQFLNIERNIVLMLRFLTG